MIVETVSGEVRDMSPWMRFTVEHPWLSAALLALLPALVFGFIAQREEGTEIGIVVGLIFWLLFFVGGGIVQTVQARRLRESLERDEAPSPNPLFIWMRAHPWISAAVGAVVSTAGTFARLVASGDEALPSLVFGSALGAGLFVLAAVIQMLNRRRGRSDPRDDADLR